MDCQFELQISDTQILLNGLASEVYFSNFTRTRDIIRKTSMTEAFNILEYQKGIKEWSVNSIILEWIVDDVDLIFDLHVMSDLILNPDIICIEFIDKNGNSLFMRPDGLILISCTQYETISCREMPPLSSIKVQKIFESLILGG